MTRGDLDDALNWTIPEPSRWQRLRWKLDYHAARFACRVRGHKMHGGRTWTDCGWEHWAVCTRCGQEF